MLVTDYANGTAPRKELIWYENMWLSPDLYARVKFVFEYIRTRGGRISGTEGYRWKGVPNDANVRNAAYTSDGTSNQWFQKGRQRRGETPAAATPGTSEHGKGKSVDTDTNSPIWRDEALRLVGMKRTVASETWHADVVGAPLVNLSAYQYKGGSYSAANQIKEIVAMNEVFLVSYSSKTDRNGIVLASLDGRWKKLSDEQWRNAAVSKAIAGIKTITPVNDREYDILRDLCVN